MKRIVPAVSELSFGYMAREIPAAMAFETDLQIFRRGFDTFDIAVFRRRSEATVSSNIHLLRTAERKALAVE